MPKPACEDDLVMMLVVVGHLQKRSAVQAEKADHFELGKTTAGLLVAILWPLELVGTLSQSPQGNWRWTRKVKAKTGRSPFPTNRKNFFVEPSTTIESLKNSSTRCELLASRCS
jgi:hypothetical protein